MVNVSAEAKLFPAASVYVYVIFGGEKCPLKAAHSSANYVEFVKLPVFILAKGRPILVHITNGTVGFHYDPVHCTYAL